MTVRYAPPVPSWHIDARVETEVLREGPAYIRGPRSTRWHRVRSAELTLRSWEPDEIRRSWVMWCGQAMHDRNYDPWLTDDPPAVEPRCGTCEGRYAGTQPGTGWVFSPYDESPPSLCPGSSALLVAETAWNRATCLVCREPVKLRASGGWANSRWGAQRHAPGPGLVAPCEIHGWLHLTLSGDTVVCRCQMLAHLRRQE